MSDTIRDIKGYVEAWGEKYVDIEVYKPMGIGEHYPNHFHTDNCKYTDDWDEDTEIGLFELMDKEDYEHTILANSSMEIDDYWADWNDEDKVLVCMKKGK